MKRNLLPFLMLTLLTSCKDLFQYSPNEIRLEENEKNINQRNIERIKTLPVKDTFSFIVTGDSQRFYDELDEFVLTVNKRSDAEFVLLNGDISDFGLNREFKWVNERFSKLNIPYIGVIGNHDMLGNGRKVYNQMFGAEDFTFHYGRNKFICLNTNSEEVKYNGTLPNLSFLQRELVPESDTRNEFIVAHVPAVDHAFDQSLAPRYASLLAQGGKVRLSIHGHQSNFSYSEPFNDGIKYLVVCSVDKRCFVVVHVTGQTYTIENVSY